MTKPEMTKSKSILFTFLLVGILISNHGMAQCPDQWVQQISALPSGNLANNEPNLVIDKDGNVIVSNAVFNADTLIAGGQVFPETNSIPSPNTDFFIAKYDNAGTFLWLKTILGAANCSPFDMDVDVEGNIYVGGLMTESMTIDGLLIEFPAFFTTYPGYFILKFSPSGELLWHHTATYKSSRCYRLSWNGDNLTFAIPYSDSVEIGGQVFYSDGEQDILIGQLSSNGSLIDAVNIGGTGNITANSLECDSIGCILQGQYDDELVYDGIVLSTGSSSINGFYQLAFDPTNSVLWANSSVNSSSLNARVRGLAFTADNEAFFGGFYWNDSFLLDGNSLPSPERDDFFIGKLNRTSGSVSWLKKTNGESWEGLWSMAEYQGNAIVAGEFYSDSVSFDNEYVDNTNDGENDGIAFSISNDGDLRCALNIAGTGQNAIQQVDFFNDGHIALLAYVNGSVDFGNNTYTAQGGYDLLVIKTCLSCDSITGVDEIDKSTISSLTISPNPVNDNLDVLFETNTNGRLSIQITDTYGRVLRSLNVPDRIGQTSLNLTDLSSGVYFCTLLRDDNILATKKLMRQK
ncbi:MAG: hypothetical protein RL266_570 [Bacteroidota bacterium]|jgi:hypothetical protein